MIIFFVEHRPPQPSPPMVLAGPSCIQFSMPDYPSQTTFVTIRFAKDNERYQVYDWRTKKLMSKGGNAIPIDEFTDQMTVELEPNTSYQIKYCIRVGESWSKSSHFVRCKTLVSLTNKQKKELEKNSFFLIYPPPPSFFNQFCLCTLVNFEDFED